MAVREPAASEPSRLPPLPMIPVPKNDQNQRFCLVHEASCITQRAMYRPDLSLGSDKALQPTRTGSLGPNTGASPVELKRL